MAMSGEKTGEFEDKDGRKPGILGPHDIGGLEEEYRTIDKSERGFHLWEMQVCPLHPNRPWFSMRLIPQNIASSSTDPQYPGAPSPARSLNHRRVATWS